MSQARRLLEAFHGSDVAHGRTIVGKQGRNGKVEAKSSVVRETLTEERMQEHLDGKVGIGSIPINEANECRWGALDIDTYPLDLVALNAEIVRRKMPLILCRSKSGGAHLFLFLKDFEPASIVREYLREMSIALGYSGCEIFPKQDTILAERGDVGNFINLPYFDEENTTRYALNGQGEGMDIDEFLNLVAVQRVSLAELNAMDFAGERKHFTDGPYCLEVIAARGPITEFRNITLFAIGVYCRLKWPDDWKAHLEEYNRTLCSPALDATEVVNIIKSLEKKEYFYQCDVCPLRDHCDKNICKSRPYGVGNSAPDMPALGGLTILLSEPRLYFLDVDGRRLQLTVEQLQNPMLWQRACMEQLDMMPPTIKPTVWQQTVNHLMSESVKIEVPEELTVRGQFNELLRLYCTSRIRATAPEEIELGKPWTEGGLTKFTIGGLEQFLRNRGFTEYKRVEIQERIKDLNGTDDCHGHQRIRREGGKPSTIRVWWVPEFKETEVELQLEEATYDVPF
jgi:hypothetical protein